MKNIAILICIGCNSQFDRKKLYQQIRSELDGKYNIVAKTEIKDDEKFDLTVLVNGCMPECHTPDKYNGNCLLINETNYKNAVPLIEEALAAV